MPEMNGLELMLELTRSFPNVKVIAMSGGLESAGTLNVAKLLGARQTFQKPLDIEEFTQCRSVRSGGLAGTDDSSSIRTRQ
jgi:DNA-binding NarL/FixJ family response regulator